MNLNPPALLICCQSLIYKLLIILLTKSLTKLLFFLLLINQAEATSFQSISLTNLNVTTIKSTFMSNPNSPIRPMMCTPNNRQQPLPPPVGFVKNYTQPTQGRSCPFVALIRTPAMFRPPPVPASGLSYTIEVVVYNTVAREMSKVVPKFFTPRRSEQTLLIKQDWSS